MSPFPAQKHFVVLHLCVCVKKMHFIGIGPDFKLSKLLPEYLNCSSIFIVANIWLKKLSARELKYTLLKTKLSFCPV